MKRLVVLALCLAGFAGAASAIQVSCFVSGGSVLAATNGGSGWQIAGGTGISTGGGTGTVSCPGISTGSGVLLNYQVLGTVSYIGGPVGTTAGTSVAETLTIVGGALNGTNVTGTISGGEFATGVVPGVPFQIGSTLGGVTSYAGFTVNVGSLVIAGGPVSFSNGNVLVSYQVGDPVPEPATFGLIGAGLVGIGLLFRRRR